MKSTGPWVTGYIACAAVGLLASVAGFAANEKTPTAKADAKAPAVKADAKKTVVAPEAAEFFETHVRPVLAENCAACHGPERQMADLRLDARAHLLKSGGRGPAIVPGDPEKSPLIRAIRYTGKVKMPPQGKLPDAAIQALTTWVKMGAPWPDIPVSEAAKRAAKTGAYVITAEQKRHWSFRPVQQPALPAVRNTAWATAPLDRFILAGLEKKGLQPAPPADRLTLLRRATLDLTGLPPTIAEIDAFLADRSPNAFDRAVDRLLASPRYGERWGRHWLDVARYADTKGYVFEEERRYPHAYNYRDYVIRAFNEDLPYNQFILQQLAADHLPLNGDKRPLAAMGFLTVGRRFLNNRHDIIDDRIDVMTRGLMGLTVSCARCHNHKFDPISTNDYYSLYGVFASSDEPDPAVISPASRNEPYFAHEKRLKAVEGEAAAITEKQRERLQKQFRAEAADYLLAGSGKPREGTELNPGVREKWEIYLRKGGAAPPPIFRAWRAFVELPAVGFAAQAKELAAKLAENKDPDAPLNPLVAKMLAGDPPASLEEVARRYGALFTRIDQKWQDLQAAHTVAAALAADSGQEAPRMPRGLPDRDEEAIRQVFYGGGSPLNVREGNLEPYYEASARDRLKSLRESAKKLRDTMPPAPEYAMVLADAKELYKPRVFVRGNPRNPGEEVPRQFLQILAGEERRPFRKGSGRLELAQAIASPTNPLTARVMVNRVWMHHFGEGLVRTPGDFGTRSDPPTHPELLDYLSARFIATGWSIKKLHRLIMLSSTYQMSSQYDARSFRVDPENRLLWRMNRRRLELEALRDSLLAVAGRLDTTLGGPAVEITQAPFPNRRTVYGFIERQNLPGLFRTFDLASPDTTNAQRYRTTVPQQALFMMNSPFVVEQARHLAGRPDVVAMEDPARRIRYAYRLLYGRLPTSEEQALGLSFLQAAQARGPQAAVRDEAAWQYGFGAYDPATRRVTSFAPLPHWTGQVWQGGPEFPDAKLGHLRLTATGGHAGPHPRYAAIRRWVAPRDAVVAVSGTLGHAGPQGDGVQARVVSSREGELGQWLAHDGKTETAVRRVVVKRGDTIDFVVECRASDSYDSFTWAPTVREARPAVTLAATSRSAASATWSAEAGFGGPTPEAPKPLSAWEEYCQVLLMANELAFVD